MNVADSIRYVNFYHGLRRLPRRQAYAVAQVMWHYVSLDKCIKRFQRLGGVHCLPGCGSCCEGRNVEATVLEMMPMAVALYRLKECGQWQEDALFSAKEPLCIFYNKDNSVCGSGCCSMYHFRPLLCRLFGFSVRKNKHGQMEFFTCARIRTADPRVYERVQGLIKEGMAVPMMTDFSMRVYSIDPYLSRERLPVTQALQRAYENVAFLCGQKAKSRRAFFFWTQKADASLLG